MGASAKRIVMPFGAGPRLCPGRYLALLQIKMLASMLGRNFIMERVDQVSIEERFKFTMEPVNLKVKLTKR
jgi:cytochrome P450